MADGFSTENDKRNLFTGDVTGQISVDSYEMYQRHYRAMPDATPEQQMLYADLQMFCIDNANVLMDGLSMAFSVEVRPPFLSKRFAQFAFSIPHHLKIRGRTTKRVLRDAYRTRLPSFVTQSKKTGLVSPLAHLIRHQLRELTQHSFASASKHPYLNAHYIQRLLTEHLSEQRDHGLQLYVLLNYFRWYDQFIEAPVAQHNKLACA